MKHFIFTSIITFAAVAAQADSVALKQRIARGLNMHPAIECVSTFEHTENTRVQHTTDRSLIIDVQVGGGQVYSAQFTVKDVVYTEADEFSVVANDKNGNKAEITFAADGVQQGKTPGAISINGKGQDYLKLECGLK